MIYILHILGDANVSGAPIHVLTLAKQLDKKRFRSLVICPNGPISDELTWANVPYQLIPMANKFDIRAYFAIKKIIREQKRKDKASKVIIHCHGVRAGFLGRLAAKHFPYPIIYTEHLWTSDYHLPHKLNETIQLAFLRWLDRYTTMTIGVSHAVSNFLVSAGIVPKNKIATIHNAVPATDKATFAPGTQPAIIGSVGSLTWQKNYSYLIELLPLIQREVPDIRLEIVGKGPQDLVLKSLITEKQLADRVTFMHVPHEDLAQEERRWTLYVQPSVNESFGLAMAEAVANGLPVLATRLAATTEVLGTEEALFDLADKEKTAKKIVELLKNKQKRETLFRAELSHVKQFTPKKMIGAHEALYAKLAES